MTLKDVLIVVRTRGETELGGSDSRVPSLTECGSPPTLWATVETKVFRDPQQAGPSTPRTTGGPQCLPAAAGTYSAPASGQETSANQVGGRRHRPTPVLCTHSEHPGSRPRARAPGKLCRRRALPQTHLLMPKERPGRWAPPPLTHLTLRLPGAQRDPRGRQTAPLPDLREQLAPPGLAQPGFFSLASWETDPR